MTFRISTLWLLVLLCEAPCFAKQEAANQVQDLQTNRQGSVFSGKKLFTGATRFKNGGPACAACHSIAGLAFPNGGSLGPDLTGTYTKLGPLGLDAAMQTLYFPAMEPIFNVRPLTPQEQQDLKVFFTEAQSSTPPRDSTPVLVGLAFAGCLGLLVMTWGAGRSRPEPARQSLLKRSAPEGGTHA
jgi:hypothetical protein